MNLSSSPQQVHLTGAALNVTNSMLLLATPGTTAPHSTTFTLPPFAVLVSTTR